MENQGMRYLKRSLYPRKGQMIFSKFFSNEMYSKKTHRNEEIKCHTYPKKKISTPDNSSPLEISYDVLLFKLEPGNWMHGVKTSISNVCRITKKSLVFYPAEIIRN